MADDNHNNVLVFLRRDRKGHEMICAVNFAPVPWDNYRFGVPKAAGYEVLFNTDDTCWGGSGCGLSAGGRINVDDIPSHGGAVPVADGAASGRGAAAAGGHAETP